MLRMIVEGIGFDHLRQTVVVLKDWDGRKLLPIWIGPNEAKAIAWEMEGIAPPRPGTHDLLLTTIRSARGHITRVVINDLQDATFYATLDIDTPRGLRHIDARPSDAIAIAVRARCPVFVAGDALSALIDIEEAMLTRPNDETQNTETSDEETWFQQEARPGTPPPPPGFPDERTDSPAINEVERFRRLLDDWNDD